MAEESNLNEIHESSAPVLELDADQGKGPGELPEWVENLYAVEKDIPPDFRPDGGEKNSAHTQAPKVDEQADSLSKKLLAEGEGKNAVSHRVLKVDELPDGLSKKFLVSDEAPGKYLFHDKSNKTAFEDQGARLRTKEEDPQIIQSMVEVCKAKGWSSIKVSGSNEFRREAWLQASTHGLTVEGYSPTVEDRARLDALNKAAMKNTLSQADTNTIGNQKEPEAKTKDSHMPGPEVKTKGSPVPEPEVKAKGSQVPSKAGKSIYSKETIAMGAVATSKGMSEKELKKYFLPQAENLVRALKKIGVEIPPLDVYDNKAPSRAKGVQIQQVAIEREKDIEQPKVTPKR